MIFTDSYPPYDRGGADKIAFYHAAGLRDRGWEVAVVCSQGPKVDASITVREEDGILVYRLFPLHPLTKHTTPSFGDRVFQLSATPWNPMLLTKLGTAIDNFSPDIYNGIS